MDNTHHKHVPMWLLVLVTLSGTLAIHIFVPALPSAGRDLQADSGSMRLTISVFILGLAFGQLCYGPLADRYGRRPFLLGGLCLYSVASIVAMFSTDVAFLVWSRLAQAVGACAGIMLGRTIVRDLSGPKETARSLATLNIMAMIGPALAPMAGGIISETFGWRSIFVVLASAGFIAAFFVWKLLPETKATLEHTRLSVIAKDYFKLAVSSEFVGFAVCGACSTTSMFAFLASAPYIFEEIHRPPHESGYYLAMLIAGVSLGAVVTRQLVLRLPMKTVLLCGSCLCLASALVLLGVVVTGWLGVVTIVLPMLVFSFGAGIASPVALTLSVSVNPRLIGSASGLYGFFQMGIGAVCATLAGIGGDPALATAVVLACATLLAQASFWLATASPSRRGNPS